MTEHLDGIPYGSRIDVLSKHFGYWGMGNGYVPTEEISVMQTPAQTQAEGEEWPDATLPAEGPRRIEEARTTVGLPAVLPRGAKVAYTSYYGWPAPLPQPYRILRRSLEEQDTGAWVVRYCIEPWTPVVGSLGALQWVDAHQVQVWEEP